MAGPASGERSLVSEEMGPVGGLNSEEMGPVRGLNSG